MNPLGKRTVRENGPHQQGAENGLAKDVSNFRSRQIAANFAAILSGLYQARKQGVTTGVIYAHDFAHRTAGKVGLQQGTNDGGIARGFRGHSEAEVAQERGHGLVTLHNAIDGDLQLGDLHVAKGDQEMFLAGKIVEESAFADVGGFGDVFDGGFGKAFLGEEVQGGAEERLASGGTAASAATEVGVGRREGRSRGGCQ